MIERERRQAEGQVVEKRGWGRVTVEESERSCGFLYVFLAIVKCVENIRALVVCAIPAFLSFSQIINHFFIYVHTHTRSTYTHAHACPCLRHFSCPKLDN